MSAPVLDRQLAREPAAVASARRAMGAWLDEVGVDPDRGQDVVIVASELLTLGVTHGARAPMDLRVWTFPSDVYLEVGTVDQADSDAEDSDLLDPDRAIRSLVMVRRLADRMVVKQRGAQSVVCCRFDLSRPRQVAS